MPAPSSGPPLQPPGGGTDAPAHGRALRAVFGTSGVDALQRVAPLDVRGCVKRFGRTYALRCLFAVNCAHAHYESKEVLQEVRRLPVVWPSRVGRLPDAAHLFALVDVAVAGAHSQNVELPPSRGGSPASEASFTPPDPIGGRAGEKSGGTTRPDGSLLSGARTSARLSPRRRPERVATALRNDQDRTRYPDPPLPRRTLGLPTTGVHRISPSS